MRFFTSQNKQNNNDYDITSSDYPQTVEIPTSSSQSSPDDDNHHDTIPNNSNDSDDEGYDEFLRVCMNSMVSFYSIAIATYLNYSMKSLYSPDVQICILTLICIMLYIFKYSPKSQSKDIATAVALGKYLDLVFVHMICTHFVQLFTTLNSFTLIPP